MLIRKQLREPTTEKVGYQASTFYKFTPSFIRRLFEENEELVQMFSRFLDLKSKEERFDMVELGKHAEKVMAALDEGIRGLDNMDDFLTCLHQVGATHTKIPDFNPQYFWVSS